MYRRIGGLWPEEAGYRKVRINPEYACGLECAKTEYESIHGKIAVFWKKEADGIHLDVELPPNVTGVVKVGETMVKIGNGKYHWVIG